MKGIQTILLGLVTAALLLIPTFSFALVQDIDAVNENGRELETVTTNDDIYVSGECSEAADEYVELFVLKNRTNWDHGDALVDISDTIETVKVDANGEIPLTRIWHAPLPEGEYDVAIDVDGDKEYDEGEDCIDDDNHAGFTVIDVGEGAVRFGNKNPDEHFKWDVEDDEPFVVLMQMRLSVDDFEDIHITSFELEASGSGHDTKSLKEVLVAEDRGSDGIYVDGRDPIWGTGTYNHDNGIVTIPVNETIRADKTENILIVYLMGKDLDDDETFRVDLEEVMGEGTLSEKDIELDGTPLRSVVMTVSGSGNARVVKRDTAPVTQDASEEDNVDSTANSPVSSFFRSVTNNGDAAEGVGDGLPPLGLRVAFVLILGFILLFIVWKLIRALIESSVRLVQHLRERKKTHDKFDHRL